MTETAEPALAIVFLRARACKDVQARSGGAEGGTGIEAFLRSWAFVDVRGRARASGEGEARI